MINHIINFPPNLYQKPPLFILYYLYSKVHFSNRFTTTQQILFS